MKKVKLVIDTEADYITLTTLWLPQATGQWTSSCTEGFMAVTAHFIDKNWVLKSMLLQCFPFTERHTSENLTNELIRVANDFGLSRKIYAIVSDNNANIMSGLFV